MKRLLPLLLLVAALPSQGAIAVVDANTGYATGTTTSTTGNLDTTAGNLVYTYVGFYGNGSGCGAHTFTMSDSAGGNTWTAQGGGSGDGLGSATYSDVVALWTACSGYLKSDGTCSTTAMWRHDGATMYFAVDAGSEGSASFGTLYGVSASALSLGTNQNQTAFFPGRIGRVLAYNTALSGGDMTSAWTYMEDY